MGALGLERCVAAGLNALGALVFRMRTTRLVDTRDPSAVLRNASYEVRSTCIPVTKVEMTVTNVHVADSPVPACPPSLPSLPCAPLPKDEGPRVGVDAVQLGRFVCPGRDAACCGR